VFLSFYLADFNQIKSLQALTAMYVGMAQCSLKEMKKIHLDWISFSLKLNEQENELLMNQEGAGLCVIGIFYHRQEGRPFDCPLLIFVFFS
jgi:hypothetical protein